MSTVYPVSISLDVQTTIDDMIAYLLPKVERYISKHYFGLSYDLQQELTQAGITALWEEVRCGKLKPTDQPNYWMTACKTGIIRAMEDLKRETGVRIKTQDGQTYIENRIEYECDLSFEDSQDTGLEKAERSMHHKFGPQDPDGGRCEHRIDFEWLLTKAFSLLKTCEVEDCTKVALHLAFGQVSAVDFWTQNGWSQSRYYTSLDRLKEVFYAAAHKERPAKQKNGATVDAKKVLELYQQGYGSKRIARLLGCSDSRADQIIQAAKRQHGALERSTKRAYNHQLRSHPHSYESAAD
jgi:RNA polymerase sigma factor (sigma-70 family)